MTVPGVLAAGVAVGVAGSVHCIGMCGGIAAALAMPPAAGTQRLRPSLLRQLAYGFGRVTSYALAGAAAAAFGTAAVAALGPSGNSWLRGLAAALIVALGLYLGGWWTGLAALERAGAVVWRRIAPAVAALRSRTSLPGSFALGLLWGWLPCGLVYSALALAATSGGAASGAALMAGFGIGTMPAVAGAGMAAVRVGALLRAPASRQVAGAMVVGFGVWTMIGSGLVPLPGKPSTRDHCAGHSTAVPSAQTAEPRQ